MENDFRSIEENLKEIRYNIAEACERASRPAESVRLMAVTKTVPFERINHAVSLGIDLLGENRVQEYQSKRDFYDKSAEVQFIGHLQTNKVKYIIDSVSMIQSVDSIKLGAEINRLSALHSKVTDVLVEVNIGAEESKDGVAPSELNGLLCGLSEMKNIHVCGLMTIPPPFSGDIYLGAMQELFMRLKDEAPEGIGMDILSMGMTHDYAEAIKYGSTLVRIGTGLFGARNYR